jgi:hypothetical protein
MSKIIPVATAGIWSALVIHSQLVHTVIDFTAELNAQAELRHSENLQKATQLAMEVCQYRMMNGEYGNDESKMDADVQKEIQHFLNLFEQ